MNTISDIMFWISNGLLVPDIVLLILLFFRSLLLVGSFFGQYVAIRKTDKLIREQMETLSTDNVDGLGGKLPEKSNALIIIYMKKILKEQHNKAQLQRLLANFEIAADKDLATSKTLAKLGPILGLMGTLIPMGPALVGLQPAGGLRHHRHRLGGRSRGIPDAAGEAALVFAGHDQPRVPRGSVEREKR